VVVAQLVGGLETPVPLSRARFPVADRPKIDFAEPHSPRPGGRVFRECRGRAVCGVKEHDEFWHDG
jgi:hypothetical protein